MIAPKWQATTGTYDQLLKEVKASVPYPTNIVKSLAPKSRAGLMGYPTFSPKQMPMLSTTNPKRNGCINDGSFVFFSSVSPRTQNRRMPVPNTWSRNPVPSGLFTVAQIFYRLYLQGKANRKYCYSGRTCQLSGMFWRVRGKYFSCAVLSAHS